MRLKVKYLLLLTALAAVKNKTPNVSNVQNQTKTN